MIWMTWQQHRSQVLIGAIALALLTLFLLLTGIHVAADYQPIAACLTHAMLSDARCFTIVNTFRHTYQSMDTVMMLLLLLLPLVVGILVGAPLVAREVEQKTYLFAWTQGITRQRWLVVKLVLVLLAGMLLEVAITSLWIWWHGPLGKVFPLEGPLDLLVFDTGGIVPIAAVLFALSLGTAMGALVRRTIPGIALTTLLYLAILLPIIFLRVNAMHNSATLPPAFTTWDGFTQSRPALPDGAAEIGSGFMDHQMHILPDTTIGKACSTGHLDQCLHDHGWYSYLAYLPASWFWPLQGIEAALFVLLAVILSMFTIWWIRYHIS